MLDPILPLGKCLGCFLSDPLPKKKRHALSSDHDSSLAPFPHQPFFSGFNKRALLMLHVPTHPLGRSSSPPTHPYLNINMTPTLFSLCFMLK